MIDRLPKEIYHKIVSRLAQDDKTALTYVSKKIYDLTLPSLYQNLYLNERYYFASDYDNTLGTHKWSVLYFDFKDDDYEEDTKKSIQAKLKFRLLVRSLAESPMILCPLINRIHCTWHLDQETLISFLTLLNKYANNLMLFESFIKGEIIPYLWTHASTLQSLNLTPPEMLPNSEAADAKYFELMRYNMGKYNMNQIKDLTIHVNALSFFSKKMKPLQIRSLCLNLRDDTFAAEPLDDSIHYYDVFDTSILNKLEILSWYNEAAADIDLYSLWNLRDFYEFKNIENLSFLSLFASEEYIQGCIENFHKLKTLKIDFMFDVTLSKATVDLMGKSECSRTLEYIDMKIEDLDVPLLSIENDEVSYFDISVTCKCDDCKSTLNEVILQKYFPSKESLLIKNFHDVEQRNFILQMFKLFTIVPYSSAFNEYPSIGYYSKPLADHVSKVNSLLHPESDKSQTKFVTEEDVIRLFHMYMHSMKKTFDYFLSRFRKLQFLILNDLPTKVIQYDETQRCNVPMFHYHNYKSNQVYELFNDESLFD